MDLIIGLAGIGSTGSKNGKINSFKINQLFRKEKFRQNKDQLAKMNGLLRQNGKELLRYRILLSEENEYQGNIKYLKWVLELMDPIRRRQDWQLPDDGYKTKKQKKQRIKINKQRYKQYRELTGAVTVLNFGTDIVTEFHKDIPTPVIDKVNAIIKTDNLIDYLRYEIEIMDLICENDWGCQKYRPKSEPSRRYPIYAYVMKSNELDDDQKEKIKEDVFKPKTKGFFSFFKMGNLKF